MLRPGYLPTFTLLPYNNIRLRQGYNPVRSWVSDPGYQPWQCHGISLHLITLSSTISGSSQADLDLILLTRKKILHIQLHKSSKTNPLFEKKIRRQRNAETHELNAMHLLATGPAPPLLLLLLPPRLPIALWGIRHIRDFSSVSILKPISRRLRLGCNPPQVYTGIHIFRLPDHRCGRWRCGGIHER